ncbi:MAG: DUF309 domain-containing protein [Deinococcota bacterium]
MTQADLRDEHHANWLRGVQDFNQANYWEAHESWEAIWLTVAGDAKHFYGGLILLAAALHKARNMVNPRGGRRNYAKALAHLAYIEDDALFHGVDVRWLEAAVHQALQDTNLKPQLPLEV